MIRLFGLALICAVVVPTQAFAQRDRRALEEPGARVESVLYAFKGGSDGAQPLSGLVMDAAGVLYGTTYNGGSTACAGGCGTVFKLTPSSSGYTESIIYRFTAQSDGSFPSSSLMIDSSGALYGTTYGEFSGCPPSCGSVFKLTPTSSGYSLQALYTFAAGSDGYNPIGGVVADSSGNLYGTTSTGGTDGAGTVYELQRTSSGYAETTIYQLSLANTAVSEAGLLLGPQGELFGTASQDSVFELRPGHGGYGGRILHKFLGGAGDGKFPSAPLIADGSGALYSTTYGGGKGEGCRPSFGCGTVYKLTPVPHGYTESVIHVFQSADGAYPEAGLLAGGGGALYGTTMGGGRACGAEGPGGCGTVFRLRPSGTGYAETVLYKFKGGADGAAPASQLIADGSGALYGTAFVGGISGCSEFGGCGVVFKLSP